MSAHPTWEVAPVVLCGVDGHVVTAGWRYGALFIDYRPMIPERGARLPFCWMVSEVHKGRAVVGLLTDQAQARVLVEALHTLADWSELRVGRRPPESVKRWLDLLPCGWCVASDTISPFSVVEHPAEVAQ